VELFLTKFQEADPFVLAKEIKLRCEAVFEQAGVECRFSCGRNRAWAGVTVVSPCQCRGGIMEKQWKVRASRSETRFDALLWKKSQGLPTRTSNGL
jgi:hypothetical protein